MERLKELGWQKIMILAGAIELVLGIIIGAIFGSVGSGIVIGILSAAITGGAIFILCVAMIYVWARENMPNLTKIFAVLFQWCGKYSLEVYLIHVLVIRVILMYNWFPKLSVLAWYFVITGLSFVLAVALSACTKLLNKKISI